MLSFICFGFLVFGLVFFLSLIFDWLCVSCIRSGAQDFVENKVEEKIYTNIYPNFKGSIKINLFNCNATKIIKVILHLPIATY